MAFKSPGIGGSLDSLRAASMSRDVSNDLWIADIPTLVHITSGYVNIKVRKLRRDHSAAILYMYSAENDANESNKESKSKHEVQIEYCMWMII